MPSDWPTTDVTLTATERLSIGDRADIIGSGGGYSSVVGTTGEYTVELGSSSNVGNVFSGRDVWLRSSATVNGDLVAPNGFYSQDNYCLLGVEKNELPSFWDISWDYSFSSVSNDGIFLNSGESLAEALVPGNYEFLKMHPNTEVTLTAGEYYFNEFQIDSGAILNIDDSDGVVSIFITGTNNTWMRGNLTPYQNDYAKLFLGYNGTSDIFIENRFFGTIVAPNAKVVVRRSFGAAHMGQIFAKNIEIDADATWEHKTFPLFTSYCGGFDCVAEEMEPDCDLPGLEAIFDDDGNIVDIVDREPVAGQELCEIAYCVENYDEYIETNEAGATIAGCEGIEPLDNCPILSDGSWAEGCGGIEAISADEEVCEGGVCVPACTTVTMCPSEGALGSDDDATGFKEIQSEFALAEALAPSFELSQAYSEINPCDWDRVKTEDDPDYPVSVVEMGREYSEEGISWNEYTKENDWFGIHFAGGHKDNSLQINSDGNTLEGYSRFADDANFRLGTHIKVESSVRLFKKDVPLFDFDLKNTVETCRYDAIFDIKLFGKSEAFDIDVVEKFDIGLVPMETTVHQDTISQNKSTSDVEEDACIAAYDVLQTKAKAVNEVMWEAGMLTEFWNKYGNSTGTMDVSHEDQSVVLTDAIVEDYVERYQARNELADDYAAASNTFKATQQDTQDDHYYDLHINESAITLGLQNPARASIGIGPFDVTVEANASAELSFNTQMTNQFEFTSQDTQEETMKVWDYDAKAGVHMEPDFDISGYVDASFGIGIKIARASIGVRGEISIVDLAFPIGTEYSLKKETPDASSYNPHPDNYILAAVDSTLTSNCKHYANMDMSLFSGVVKLVARVKVLFAKKEWKKTLFDWDGFEINKELVPNTDKTITIGDATNMVNLPIFSIVETADLPESSPAILDEDEDLKVDIVKLLSGGTWENFTDNTLCVEPIVIE